MDRLIHLSKLYNNNNGSLESENGITTKIDPAQRILRCL